MALGQKEIRLSIKANTAKFEETLKKIPNITDKEAKKMARKFATQFDKAERAAKKSSRNMANSYQGSFGKMGKAASNFKNVLAAGVFAAAARGIFHLADSASVYVDKIGVMSRQTGLASETLIGMEFASQAAGLSLDNLSNGLNTFTNKAGQAHNVGGAATRVFDRLGVSVTGADGSLRDMDEVFRETLRSLSEMDSTSEQATTAIELFGARGARIAAVFGDGTESLDEWSKKAKEAGIVMDSETLKASEDMDRAMAELKLTMRATSLETGKNLIPAMILVTKAIGQVISKIAEAVIWWDSFTDSIFGNLEAGQEAQDNFAGMEKAMLQVVRAGKETNKEFKSLQGVPVSAISQAEKLERRMRQLEDVSVTVAEGYELSSDQLEKYNSVIELARDLANEMGMNLDELAGGFSTSRAEMREMESADFSELDSQLAALGSKTTELGSDAEIAADKLAALNRAFELDALARVDEPLANFHKEIDRVNAALLEGLDAQLGHDAILAAVDELNNSRAEKEEEIQDRIAELTQKRIDAQMAAETAAAEQAAAIQSEFHSGVQDLANDVFELAKNQKGITFEQAQGLAVAQAIMNTAVAVTKTFAEMGPAGIPLAGIIAAQGAIQIAAIQSQSFHSGGMVGGTPDEVPANLLRGEAVINRAGVDALGGEQAVNAINSGGGGSMPMVIVNKYKHRTLDVQIRDQLKTDSALTRATANGARAGHR